ncbi:MAG: diphthine--ammonia ligase [Cytophagales bacterium]|nr:diphthine--ammonia ligase [Cytophagales bacterium]
MPPKVGVLWTGGKDSCLAFYEAQRAGYKIDCLITFVPGNPVFLAHPIPFMKYQAKAINLPHRIVEIKEPYKKGYREAFSVLKERHNINTLVTGDIDEIDGHSNWVAEYGGYAGIDIQIPLWKMDRLEVLKRLLKHQFKVIFSCVKKPWFSDEWLGKEITVDTLYQLSELNKSKGIDVCGERGEYHTMVCDAPFFQKSISINSFSKCEKDDLMFIDIGELALKDK